MSATLKQDPNGRLAVRLDKAAVCISVVCLAQCLMLPVILIGLPMVSLSFMDHELFHRLLLVVILPVSLVAFTLGWSAHRNSRMLIPGLTGLAILAFAATLGHDVLSLWGEALMTSLGGILLITGHFLNLRGRRNSCVQPVEPESN